MVQSHGPDGKVSILELLEHLQGRLGGRRLQPGAAVGLVPGVGFEAAFLLDHGHLENSLSVIFT